MQYNSTTYKLTDKGNLSRNMFFLGGFAMVMTAVGYFVDHQQFFFSYLVAFTFWTTLALGGLFLVLLFHLTSTTWGVVLRRLIESIMIALPYMAILFIPIVFGMHDLYHWTHEDVLAEDALLRSKTAYLNIPFFLIRTGVYFASWFLIARSLYKTSLSSDNGYTEEHLKKMRKVSAIGMVVFALTVSFAAFDWIMALEPHWYSTIFGLYIFSGGLAAVLAFIVIFAYYLNRKGVLSEVISVEHYHDMAKMIFGFIIFWGYMAFSQYLLIWYANIPEETIFYIDRWDGGWSVFSLTLVFGHFVIPFIGLLTRSSKRNMLYLSILSGWVLLMHWIDLHWIIMPVYHEGLYVSWMDLTAWVGVGAILMAIIWTHFSKHALIPVKDYKLEESLKHEIP